MLSRRFRDLAAKALRAQNCAFRSNPMPTIALTERFGSSFLVNSRARRPRAGLLTGKHMGTTVRGHTHVDLSDQIIERTVYILVIRFREMDAKLLFDEE